MQALHRILVSLDGDLLEGPALQRATELAAATGCELHVLGRATGEPFLAQVERLRSSGLHVEPHVTGHAPGAQELIDACQRTGADLLIKAHPTDRRAGHGLLAPEDWKLLRHCPRPVLLVRHSRRWAGGQILVAIDVGNSEPQHLALHGGLVDWGFRLANLVDGRLHVLTAHPPAVLGGLDPARGLEQSIEQRYRNACVEFQNRYGLTDGQLHLEEGPADLAIPRLAERLDAAVTVIGTVARGGLSGILMGNTAELVLDRLESDVLVLKATA